MRYKKLYPDDWDAIQSELQSWAKVNPPPFLVDGWYTFSQWQTSNFSLDEIPLTKNWLKETFDKLPDYVLRLCLPPNFHLAPHKDEGMSPAVNVPISGCVESVTEFYQFEVEDVQRFDLTPEENPEEILAGYSLNPSCRNYDVVDQYILDTPVVFDQSLWHGVRNGEHVRDCLSFRWHPPQVPRVLWD